jgi:hypothetical protein
MNYSVENLDFSTLPDQPRLLAQIPTRDPNVVGLGHSIFGSVSELTLNGGHIP